MGEEPTTNRDDHARALAFWKGCANNYLAAPDYYDRQEAALREVLDGIGRGMKRCLDIGCGDGRFTVLIGGYVRKVLGIDVSESLIAKANENRKTAGVRGVKFQLGNVEDLAGKAAYDLVCCMGVTSGLVDEGVFRSVVRKVAEVSRSGGYLMMKDTLSRKDPRTNRSGDYVAIYRNAEAYRSAFEDEGFTLSSQRDLYDDGECVNRLMVFRGA